MEQFDSTLSSVIDSTLSLRCRSFGYQYSEIIRSLMSNYVCGGSCIEDVTTHLMNHLSLHPTFRTCSSDTILRAIKELTQENAHNLWLVLFYLCCLPFFYFFEITNCDLKRIVTYYCNAKVVLLAYKPLLHKPFLWKERKINSIIAVIAFLVIA